MVKLAEDRRDRNIAVWPRYLSRRGACDICGVECPRLSGPWRSQHLLAGHGRNCNVPGGTDIAAKLQRQGITATVHNHTVWASIADDAAAKYKSGRVKNIVLVGHSSGATSLPDIVARLGQQGVPVKLVIALDSVFRTNLAGRVGRYVNFYIAGGAGARVERTKGFQGKLENVNVENLPGVSHLTIDKNQLMQQKIIAAIDAAVFSGGAMRRAGRGKKQPPVPGGSP